MSDAIMGHVEVDVADSLATPQTPMVAPQSIVSRPVEEWARLRKVPAWLFKAAAIGARWQCGESFDPCLVTEAEFDLAVAFAENPHAIHNPPAPAKKG